MKLLHKYSIALPIFFLIIFSVLVFIEAKSILSGEALEDHHHAGG